VPVSRLDVEAELERLGALEALEAEIERELAKLLERQRRCPDDATVEQIAQLRQSHLAARRELNDERARRVVAAQFATR